MRSGKWAAIRTMARSCDASLRVLMFRTNVQAFMVTANSPQIDLLQRKAENGGDLTFFFFFFWNLTSIHLLTFLFLFLHLLCSKLWTTYLSDWVVIMPEVLRHTWKGSPFYTENPYLHIGPPTRNSCDAFEHHYKRDEWKRAAEWVHPFLWGDEPSRCKSCWGGAVTLLPQSLLLVFLSSWFILLAPSLLVSHLFFLIFENWKRRV